MKNLSIIIFSVFLQSFLYGQSATELYKKRNFEELVKYEKNTDKLTPEEFYMVGYAFFQLENDKKAIEFYDMAISNGYVEGSVYFYKGLSLCYMEKYDEAMKEIETALSKEPTNQEL